MKYRIAMDIGLLKSEDFDNNLALSFWYSKIVNVVTLQI